MSIKSQVLNVTTTQQGYNMQLKSLRWPVLVLLLVSSFVGSYHLAKDWRFNSDAPGAKFPPPA